MIISLAPNNILLYQYVLNDVIANNCATFVEEKALAMPVGAKEQSIIALRHDIDSMPEHLQLFTDVEKGLGLRSIIYVLTDGSTYNLVDWKVPFLALKEEGFLFGLHTIAPAMDDPIATFEKECDLFAKVFGEYPKSYTIHGVNPHPTNWQERRISFEQNLEPFRQQHGIMPCPQFFTGITAIEDSRMGGPFGYLRKDFFDLPTLPAGKKILLLTHPEHWTAHPLHTIPITNWRLGLPLD